MLASAFVAGTKPPNATWSGDAPVAGEPPRKTSGGTKSSGDVRGYCGLAAPVAVVGDSSVITASIEYPLGAESTGVATALPSWKYMAVGRQQPETTTRTWRAPAVGVRPGIVRIMLLT